jgi:mono/diheme cytochrome c family protein
VRFAGPLLSALLFVMSLAGCREQTSPDPPVLLERNMYDTERYNPESYSQFFADHRTMRTPVPGTIARDRYEEDPSVSSGLLEGQDGYVLIVPPAVVQHAGGLEKLVARGQERFTIYCAPCHGQTGDGKGMIACKPRERPTDPCQSRGFPPLPSYEDPRIRQMPDGQLFATITHGVRTMPAYGPQIPAADRWAIVSYVRALEMSQMLAATPSEPEPKK